MPTKASSKTIKISQGGQLVTSMSHENVGPANYVEKTNWRRLDDREVLREGYVKFAPNTDESEEHQCAVVMSDVEVVGLWEATRPNGERALLAMTDEGILYLYDFDGALWDGLPTGIETTGCYWQTVSQDGYLVFNNGVDLPFYYRVGDASVTPLRELRENGVASVGCIAEFNGFLLAGDITEIAADDLATQMESADPYGDIVGGVQTNRIRYKVIWSDYNAPTNWSPVIQGTIESSDKDVVVLDFPSSVFVAGETRVAVIGAGVNGGTLGGGTGYEEGVLVTDVTGNEITLETAADASLTYPLTVQVTRFADVSTFAGAASIQDDSSGVVAMKMLNRGILAVYKETGIFHGRYTGQVATPFLFTPVYTGRNVPFYPNALHSVEGDRHIYPTENRFYVYDGAGEPRIFTPLDNARSLFFDELDETTAHQAFARHNVLTKEIWFFSANGVLALDYVQWTTSWIDVQFTAAAYVRTPDGTASTNPSDHLFIHAIGRYVYSYGLTSDGETTRTRDGASMSCVLKGGLNDWGSQTYEKDWVLYVPILSTFTNGAEASITLTSYGCDNPSATPEVLGTSTLNTDVDVINGFPLFFRNIYYQDKLTVVSDTDDVGLSARSFHASRIRTDGVTRL